MTVLPGLSPDHELLVVLARRALTPALEERARFLAGQRISWRGLANGAMEHGVLPLVCRSLGRLQWWGVPEEVRTELVAASRLDAAHSALLSRALTGVLRMFQDAGLPVIPLKGVALAESLYGDVTLRVCSDLDVLVPRHAVGDSFRLLLAHGYEHADRHRIEAGEVDRLLGSNMEYALRGRTAGFEYLLELHWDIAWRWRADTAMVDHLWADARRGTVLGVDAWTISPEWELLYLAVHAARHRWSALKWLVDIHEICVRGGLDWAGVEDRAQRFGLERALHLSLGACQALLGTPLPLECRGYAPPRRLRVFHTAPGSVGGWLEALSAVRLFRRPSDKLRYLGRLLLMPTLAEWHLIRLPPALGIVYYPLRLLRLAIACGRGAVRAGVDRVGLPAKRR